MNPIFLGKNCIMKTKVRLVQFALPGAVMLGIGWCSDLSAQPFPSRYAFGVTMSQYVSMSASNTAQGYRPISLDANGPTNAPNLAVVWINDGFTNWTEVRGVTRSDYSNQVTTLSAQGYRTLCV